MSLKIRNEEYKTLFLHDFAKSQGELYDELPSSRRLKREWIKKGYNQQMSLYGVIFDQEIDDRSYKRIELLSNTPFTKEMFHLIRWFFQSFIPMKSYTIWIYDKDRGL
ncbi:unnamed protein product [marine sediment metagenome]|uniref:Uncharacterized protein n=1 Tax=marine sediment metagenome TaxID=412755 RepID=X0ZGB1_9ZZZZ